MELKERNDFVGENLGLVHALAKRFKGRGIEYDDLFQAGCVGLLKAADGFEEERGVRFSTYAVPVILGEIKRIFRDTGPIKVSRSLKELSLKVLRAREKLTAAAGQEPTVSEVAAMVGISPEEAAEAMLAGLPPMSLTAEDSEGENRMMDIPVQSCEEKLTESISLAGAMLRLPEQDRLLLHYRFYKGKTQSETARRLGMTQVQISRREAKIISALRQKLLDK